MLSLLIIILYQISDFSLMPENLKFTWIVEPTTEDNTYAGRLESTIDWLRRSTIFRAKESRAFINHNLGKIPPEFRESFINGLENNWVSALFELILARYLQNLGAKIFYEKSIQGGTKPDFTAIFPDGKIIIEAISPIINADIGEKFKKNNPLQDYIEKNKPKNWEILTLKLPDIGLADSKKEFKKAIDEIFYEIQSIPVNEKVSISKSISIGEISLVLINNGKDASKLCGGPIITYRDNTKERIMHAINKKRSQVRETYLPVLLAINASGPSSRIEHFNKSLYGHTIEVYEDFALTCSHTTFKEDGYFTKMKNSNPTYAGILACFNYGLAGGNPPILFHNPNFTEQLPKELLCLEQRKFNQQTHMIEKHELTNNNLMTGLNFPSH